MDKFIHRKIQIQLQILAPTLVEWEKMSQKLNFQPESTSLPTEFPSAKLLRVTPK